MQPTEQFILGLDDVGMISEIMREVSVLEDINYAISEWVLLRAQNGRGPKNIKGSIRQHKRPSTLTQSSKVHKDVTI